MAPTVTWIQFKQWSGCKIAGKAKVALPTTNLHMDRAYYLTAQLEAPLYGSVQSYDGAGMSGGPLHNIAVFPKSMEQGSLFPLLRHIEIGGIGTAMSELYAAYKTVGWFVAADGTLRNIQTGTKVSGQKVRDQFTPNNGVVPRAGVAWEQAKRWALLHHSVFADPATFNAQKDFAIEYLKKTQASTEAKFYAGMDLHTLRSGGSVSTANSLSLSVDFALCVYHSHSVNAPGPAVSILDATLKRYPQKDDAFAKALIYALGKKKFGRWQDTTDGKNRYDRTRVAAMKSGLWPQTFFTGPTAIMPVDLT